MKKSLTGMLALLAGAYAVHAQGTVQFANYLALTPYIYVSYKAANGATTLLGGSAQGSTAPTMLNWTSELTFGADWTVALYGAPGQNASQIAMLPLTQGLSSSTPFTTASMATPGGSLGDTTAGTWNSAETGTIVGAAGNGSLASVQVAAWYNDGGVITSLAMAQADSVPWGMSAIVNTTTGGPAVSGPSGTATALPDSVMFPFGSFTVQAAPEPSTIALGIIGASTFLMRLRRKQ